MPWASNQVVTLSHVLVRDVAESNQVITLRHVLVRDVAESNQVITHQLI